MELAVSNQVSLGDVVAFISTCVGLVIAAVTVQVKTSTLAERQKEDRDEYDQRFKDVHDEQMALSSELKPLVKSLSLYSQRLERTEADVSAIQSRQNSMDSQVIKDLSELKVAIAKLEVRLVHKFRESEGI